MDNSSLLPSPLAALLEKEISKKPNDAVFGENYRRTLELVSRGGDFNFAGLEIAAPPGVYPPRPGSSTEFFCRSWAATGLDERTGVLLELGTGSGALALYATSRGWRATGTDIDETAVRAAQGNARRNGLNAEFLCSDLFAALGPRRFDAILFNQPFLHKASVRPEERTLANASGELARRFLDEAASYLHPDGMLVFSYSNCSDDRLLDRADWSFRLAACDYEAAGQYWRVVMTGKPAACGVHACGSAGSADPVLQERRSRDIVSGAQETTTTRR